MAGLLTGRLRHPSPVLAGTAAPTASSCRFFFPPLFPSFPSTIGATQAPAAAPPLRRHHGPAVPPAPVYRGVRQCSWGPWVAEITDRNTKKMVWIGFFQSTEQVAVAYDIENVRLRCSDCGELNFPLEEEGPVPDVAPEGLRFVSDRERREDREARERLEAERRNAAMAAALAGLNPQLVEEERQRLEEFAEAKGKTDAAAGKKVKKEEEGGDARPSAAPAPAKVKEEEDAGPSTAATMINIDSFAFDWEED